MRIQRIATGRRLFPFDDSVGALFVAPQTLADAQQRAARLCDGILEDLPAGEPLELGPGLVLFDDCYLDAAALRRVLAAPGADLALCLGDEPLGRFLAPLLPGMPQDPSQRPVGLFRISEAISAPDSATLWSRLCERCRPWSLPAASSRHERLPGFPGLQPRLEIPTADAVAARLLSWVHLLWLNQALAYATPEGQRARRDRRGNAIDPQAKVHPSAYLERAVVGPRCNIEAHASLIDSVVGCDVRIADHSSLVGCTLGDGCQTLADSLLRRVVSWPHSTLSSLGLEEVLIGRGAFLTTACIFFPTLRGESVAIEYAGRWQDTGRPRLGGCVGHRAVLGARAVFAPGRVVPGGYTVVMRPEEGVGWIDPRLADGRPACWDRARLLPLAEFAPDHRPPEFDSD